MIHEIVMEFTKTSKRKMTAVLFLDVFLGLNQGVSFLMLLPVFDYLQYGEAKQNTFLLQGIEKIGVSVSLQGILLLFFMLSLVYALLRYFRGKIESVLIADTVMRLKKQVFKGILHASWLNFKKLNRSKYANDLISEIDFLGYGMVHFLKLVGGGVLFLTYLLLCLFTSVQLTLVAALCFLPLFFLQRFFTRKTLKLSEESYNLNQRFYQLVSEFLSSFKLMKISGWETYFNELFTKQVSLNKERTVDFAKTRLLLNLVYQTGGVFIFCGILLLAVQCWQLPFSSLLLLVVVASRLFPQMSALAMSYQQCMSSVPVYEGVKKKMTRLGFENLSFDEDEMAFPIRSIGIENVRFSYEEESEKWFWEKIEIKGNAITGIVGPSGVGKTTMLDMIMGLLLPTEGQVKVNDEVLNTNNLNAWQRRMAYVPQEVFLLNTTIRSNISMNLDERGVDTFLANYPVFDFIKRLPQGLDTIVGDAGVNLSGGEKQRIALARAMYAKPALLVLDEVTSALDKENTLAIISFLHQAKNNMTIVVATHDDLVISQLDNKIELG